jgi:hypothetical protein
MIAQGQLLGQHIQAYSFLSNLPESPFRSQALLQTQGGILSMSRAHGLAPVTGGSSSVLLQTNVVVHPPTNAPPGPAPLVPGELDQFVSQDLEGNEEQPIDLVDGDLHVNVRIDCGICQRRINERDAQMTTPCGHIFHFQCLRPWMAGHATCPICRQDMNGPPPLNSDSDSDEDVQVQRGPR